jgi:hypothetical protein
LLDTNRVRKLLNKLADQKWLIWFNGIGITLLFVALRWNNFETPLVRDEGEYAYAAQILARGMPPYRHSFLQKPPMVVYSYALAQAILPNTFWAPRLLAYFCIGAATVLLGLVARVEFGSGFAFPTMWLFTPMVILPEVQQFTANTEMFLLLPLIGTVAVCVFSLHRAGVPPRNLRFRWTWFVAGILGGVTVWYKYTAVPLVGAIFIAWSIRQCQQCGLLAPRLREMVYSVCVLLSCWLAALAGAILASFGALAFFIFKGGLNELWECTVVFNRAYAGSSTFGFSSLWFCIKLLWNSWWILFLLPLVLLIKPGQKLWFWGVLFFGAWGATGASVYGHYYIPVMPFWALIAVLGIHRGAAALADFLRHQEGVTRSVFIIIAIAAVCYPDLSWIARSKDQFIVQRLRTGNPFTESEDAARRVSNLTSPSDYVYIAGSEPQILYYARRLSATRFVIAYPLMFPTPFAKVYQQEMMRDLGERPPVVIVVARSKFSWLIQEDSPREFWKYLEQLLSRDYERIGGYVDEGDRAAWKEPLTNEEVTACELVLFKRKIPNRVR